MDRVVVVGRGGAGKSVISRRIGELIGAPVIELDALFWREPGLRPLARGVGPRSGRTGPAAAQVGRRR